MLNNREINTWNEYYYYYTTKFTEEQIIEWLGDPDWSYSGIVETFMDLANGDYTVENMRKDILETEDDN